MDGNYSRLFLQLFWGFVLLLRYLVTNIYIPYTDSAHYVFSHFLALIVEPFEYWVLISMKQCKGFDMTVYTLMHTLKNFLR